MAAFQAEAKREVARYYGVTFDKVDLEYSLWNALWRCFEFDKLNGGKKYPSQARLLKQLDNPALPNDKTEQEKQTMLDFTKLPSGNFRAGSYNLIYDALAKQWTVKDGKTVIASKIKGYAAAKEQAEKHFLDNAPLEQLNVPPIPATKKETADFYIQANKQQKRNKLNENNQTETKENKTMPTIKTKPATRATKPAQAETPAPTVPNVKKPVVRTAKPVTVKPFPDFETWAESNVELKQVPKTGIKKAGIEAENKKTLQGAKLRHGRERAKYNKENGLTAEVPTQEKAAPKPAQAKSEVGAAEKPVKQTRQTRAERFGKAFHAFGSQPSELEYVLAQLDNARCSKAYNVTHSRMHPYSETAKASYLANVERCYVTEQKAFETSKETGQSLPKSFYLEYYNAKDVPAEMVREPKEGLSVITGYTMNGFGKEKSNAGIKLPVTIGTRAAKK